MLTRQTHLFSVRNPARFLSPPAPPACVIFWQIANEEKTAGLEILKNIKRPLCCEKVFLTLWIHVDRHTWWASKFLQSQKFLSGSLAWSSTSLHIKHSDVSAEEEDETEGYEPFSQRVDDSRPPLVRKLSIKNQSWLWIFLKIFPHKLQFVSRLIFLLQRSTHTVHTPPPPIIAFSVAKWMEGFSKVTCNTLTNPDKTINTTEQKERERRKERKWSRNHTSFCGKKTNPRLPKKTA